MIQVVNRALSILELLSTDNNREFGLSEIADRLELHHSTCANILKTLVHRRFVDQIGAKKGYKLGYMVYKLCDSKLYNEELLQAAKDPINRLGEQLNEAVIISIIKGDKRIVLYETYPNQELQVKTKVESPVYKATTARMILSCYSPKELDDFIARIGLPDEEEWPEVKTKDDLIEKLDTIRKNKMEIYCNKNHIIGLSTPIFKNNQIIASLGVYLPDARYGAEEQKTIPVLLKETTGIINARLNAS